MASKKKPVKKEPNYFLIKIVGGTIVFILWFTAFVFGTWRGWRMHNDMYMIRVSMIKAGCAIKDEKRLTEAQAKCAAEAFLSLKMSGKIKNQDLKNEKSSS